VSCYPYIWSVFPTALYRAFTVLNLIPEKSVAELGINENEDVYVYSPRDLTGCTWSVHLVEVPAHGFQVYLREQLLSVALRLYGIE
jgi:hypothetical protein